MEFFRFLSYVIESEIIVRNSYYLWAVDTENLDVDAIGTSELREQALHDWGSDRYTQRGGVWMILMPLRRHDTAIPGTQKKRYRKPLRKPRSLGPTTKRNTLPQRRKSFSPSRLSAAFPYP